MGGPFQVVDQDLPADSGLIPEQTGGGQLGLEVLMGTDELTGVRLPRVNKDPGSIRMPICRFAQQRTLCRTIWSGEGAEFQHHIAFGPEIRQLHWLFVIEPNKCGVWGGITRMKVVGESRELGQLCSRFHVLVEPVVVVLDCRHPGRI